MSVVAVTGATGFVGRAVVRHLCARGYEVRCFSRDPERAQNVFPKGATAVGWLTGAPPRVSLLEGVDAVIHLAGEKTVGVRLSAARKQRVMASRVESTRLLIAEMKRATRPPQVFVCASAVGYYGPHDPDEALNEESAPGEDFLAQVCVNWEREAAQASSLGVRVVSARLGIVLGSEGGALTTMALPIGWGVGGAIAGGKQAVSWVDIRDVSRAIEFSLNESKVQGPINICSPNSGTNSGLTRAIAKQLGRPSFMPVPAFALRVLFAEGAEPIITGQRVLPARLLGLGFQFEHTKLEESLKHHLSRESAG